MGYPATWNLSSSSFSSTPLTWPILISESFSMSIWFALTSSGPSACEISISFMGYSQVHEFVIQDLFKVVLSYIFCIKIFSSYFIKKTRSGSILFTIELMYKQEYCSWRGAYFYWAPLFSMLKTGIVKGILNLIVSWYQYICSAHESSKIYLPCSVHTREHRNNYLAVATPGSIEIDQQMFEFFDSLIIIVFG